MKKKIKIGITGQSGFIGLHLRNFLKLQESTQIIEFQKSFFEHPDEMDAFVKQTDVIVHLAAKNRDPDPQVIYDTNISLVQDLISACERTRSKPYILFASSSQEERDNPYGQSKKRGRELLEAWAKRNKSMVAGMVIPNVFGPFGKPFYNSVVATFCHQIAENDTPKIINDSLLNLIYVGELVEEIWELIQQPQNGRVVIKPRYQLMVSELLEKLSHYNELYSKRGEIPALDTSFDLRLFTTYQCYLPEDFYPYYLTKHSDNRGSFVEIIRTNSKGQFSFSTTVPGITRGNHFHTRKVERFAVIKGKASIKIRRVDGGKVREYILEGNKPGFVDMPIWHTHNIKNIGEGELLTLFWINEAYNPDDPDTYYEEV